MEKLFDLTIPQKSIWNTEKFYKDTSIANVSGTGKIDEIVDFNMLEKAINIVVERNDALRIRIKIQNNKPMQYFDKYEFFHVDCVLVKNEEEAEKKIQDLVTTHINVLNEKLVKFIMFKFPNGKGGFNIVGNHITSDAWSSARVCSEVINVYSKLIKNESVEDTLESSYIDYINSETEYLNSDKYIKDKEFWEQRFNKQYETAKVIPNNDEKTINSKAKRKEIKISKLITKQINEYCKINRISPFVFLLGIYGIYLSKINNLDEIIIGTPMLNRKGVKEKQMIGMFVNTLPFKISIDSKLNIKDLFTQIAQDSMSMLRHQKYSFFELINYIRKNLKMNNNLYDFVISYQNAKTTANESDIKYSAKWNFNENISETINVHISDIDSEEQYNIFYDYQINCLKEKDILDLHQRILRMIEQVINSEELLVKDIKIITKQEENKWKKFNNTGEITQELVAVTNIFDDVVKKYPNNIALKFENKEVTYSELNKMVNSIANKLRAMGVKRNTPVAIILDRSVDMIVAMLRDTKSWRILCANSSRRARR
jgi:hypothetical protein